MVLSACISSSVWLGVACGTVAEDTDTERVSIETEEISVVARSVESTQAEEPEETVTEAEPSKEELELLEWQNYLMPNVQSSLNVRTQPSIESELAGKLEKGARAVILENDGEWTKIESGNLVGYVKNEYCLYDAQALAYAKENCGMAATVMADGLRLREEMNTDSQIIKRLEEGDRLAVDADTQTEEGWVAVKFNDSVYYVSAEYVTVSWNVGTGSTMEEIEEMRRKQEEEAAKKAAAQQASRQVISNEAVSASTDDFTLLASIIYCEAGGENYETQLATAAVIMNRVRSGAFPNSVREVIYQNGQFGPVKSGKLARVIAQGKATASCYQAAQDALNGADNTGGCLYFNDYNSLGKGITIGNMVFW